jgi:hypothetical protein
MDSVLARILASPNNEVNPYRPLKKPRIKRVMDNLNIGINLSNKIAIWIISKVISCASLRAVGIFYQSKNLFSIEIPEPTFHS